MDSIENKKHQVHPLFCVDPIEVEPYPRFRQEKESAPPHNNPKSGPLGPAEMKAFSDFPYFLKLLYRN